jgi:hypothetical protein
VWSGRAVPVGQADPADDQREQAGHHENGRVADPVRQLAADHRPERRAGRRDAEHRADHPAALLGPDLLDGGDLPAQAPEVLAASDERHADQHQAEPGRDGDRQDTGHHHQRAGRHRHAAPESVHGVATRELRNDAPDQERRHGLGGHLRRHVKRARQNRQGWQEHAKPEPHQHGRDVDMEDDSDEGGSD